MKIKKAEMMLKKIISNNSHEIEERYCIISISLTSYPKNDKELIHHIDIYNPDGSFYKTYQQREYFIFYNKTQPDSQSHYIEIHIADNHIPNKGLYLISIQLINNHTIETNVFFNPFMNLKNSLSIFQSDRIFFNRTKIYSLKSLGGVS